MLQYTEKMDNFLRMLCVSNIENHHSLTPLSRYAHAFSRSHSHKLSQWQKSHQPKQTRRQEPARASGWPQASLLQGRVSQITCYHSSQNYYPKIKQREARERRERGEREARERRERGERERARERERESARESARERAGEERREREEREREREGLYS
jgi:hypothetical protein